MKEYITKRISTLKERFEVENLSEMTYYRILGQLHELEILLLMLEKEDVK